MDVQRIHHLLGTAVYTHAYLEKDASELATLKAPLAAGDSPLIDAGEGLGIYLRSLQIKDHVLYAMVRTPTERLMAAFAWPEAGALAVSAMGYLETCEGAQWSRVDVGGGTPMRVITCRLTAANAQHMMDLFPFCKPTSLRERTTTIGMGDRLGLATPGHIRAARAFAVSPVLAQQSVRENDFIGRTFADVVANAAWSVFQEGFETGYGADGDHLKTIDRIDVALDAHMPMVTLDLTEVMRPEVADWSATEVDAAFQAQFDAAERAWLEENYAGKTFELPMDDGGVETVRLEAAEARRCAVMYGPALDFSKTVNDHLKERTGGAYDLEISIDETTTPTLPAHHLFIAAELRRRDVLVNSLAPRFIGDFQKAVDYIGEVPEFERQFRVHCAIAKRFGGYKISVHSGSDKFAVYPIVGRHTGMRLHLKTSGTSWLEALRVLARVEPALYRRIHAFAVSYYPTALTFYHITADFGAIKALDAVADADLPHFLEDANCRQMLHISYGGILRHPELSPALYAALHTHAEAYAQTIEAHFVRHIGLLGAPRV